MFCFFCRRFEPQLRLMHDRIRAGEIGRVRSLRSTNRDTPQMMNPAYLALSGNNSSNNTAVVNIRFPPQMHMKMKTNCAQGRLPVPSTLPESSMTRRVYGNDCVHDEVCEGYVFTPVILFTRGDGLHLERGAVYIQGGVGRPPPIGYYGIRSTSGRYASYWNVFLSYNCLYF